MSTIQTLNIKLQSSASATEARGRRVSAAGVTVPESDWKQHEAHRGRRILRLQLAGASGGLQVVVCLQGLLPSLVAGRPNTSEPRVVAGVHGCKFTVVPVRQRPLVTLLLLLYL